MESVLNHKMPEKESPRYGKGICWFCHNHCKNSGYAHEACIMDYFIKPKSRQLVAA